MYENYSETLAEFYIAKIEDYIDWDKHNYCVCSRVVVSNSEPIIFTDYNQVRQDLSNNFSNQHYVVKNDNVNPDLTIVRCYPKIFKKKVYICELNLCVTIFCQAQYENNNEVIKYSKISCKNNKLFDGFNIYLKVTSTTLDVKLLSKVFECFVLQDKKFILKYLERTNDNKDKVIRYNLLTNDNFCKIFKHDILKSYVLMNNDKITNFLLNNCSFKFQWDNFWLCNGEILVWLSWIIKYKNNIDSNYLDHYYQTINDIQKNYEISSKIKKFVKKQVKQLKKDQFFDGTNYKSNNSDVYLTSNTCNNKEEPSTTNAIDVVNSEDQNSWCDLWQNHYQEQLNNCYILFMKYCEKQIKILHTISLIAHYNLLSVNNLSCKTNQSNLIKSVDLLLKRLSNRFQLEAIEKSITTENITQDSLFYKQITNNDDENVGSENYKHEKSSFTGLNQIKNVLRLIGFAYKSDPDYQLEGELIFKKKNIKYLNKALKIHKYIRNKIMDESNCMNDLQENKTNLKINEISTICTNDDEKNNSDETNDDVTEVKKKKKKKKKKFKNKKSNLPDYVLENPILKKYYAKRYRLFSKFDEGIILDDESWFSVTPEKIAIHLAERCKSDILIDTFCGAGGNSIQFAFTCERVFAIDIDPQKIKMARHNAKVYGVEDRIEFIIGDFFCLAEKLFGDVVFLSPPWGGPSYIKDVVFQIDDIMPLKGGIEILKTANKISDNVAYYLPKNINTANLAVAAGPGSKVELEQNILGNQLVAVTAYFGDLIGK